MYPCLFKMLHHCAYQYLVAIADGIYVQFYGIPQIFINEEGFLRSNVGLRHVRF